MRCDDEVAILRAFNRAYTRRLGLLDTYLGQTEFTLSETRIMYEIVNRRDPTAAEIGRALDIDRGQISRTLKRLGGRGVVEAKDDPSHGRNQLLSLTPTGLTAYAKLETMTKIGIGMLLNELPPTRRRRMLLAATTIRDVLEAGAAPSVSLRPLQTGDVGMIIHRQALVYAQEHGYDQTYESFIVRILADYRQAFDEKRDGGWIAEADGQMVGSIFLMHTDRSEVGKLRLLYVEADARRMGIGKRLVAACVERARDVGYARLELWTDSVLAAAGSIYKRAGFELITEAPDHLFGTESMSQTWSLTL